MVRKIDGKEIDLKELKDKRSGVLQINDPGSSDSAERL